MRLLRSAKRKRRRMVGEENPYFKEMTFFHNSQEANTIGRDVAIADVWAHCFDGIGLSTRGGFVSMRSIRRSGRKLSLLVVILTLLVGSASAFAQTSPNPNFTATPLSPSDQST